MSQEKSHKLNWKDFIGSSVAGTLFFGQIVLCVLFYNWGNLDALLYLGWAILALAIVLGCRARIAFQNKGGSPVGESWLATTVVVDSGIYAVMRHPMYLSFILLILALILISQHWIAAICGVVAMTLIYTDILKEDRSNAEKFGDDYKRYQQTVPRANLVLGVIRLLRRRARRLSSARG
jgi:protein-S-isoprenylcysteine O-methyltransferase Ste14